MNGWVGPEDVRAAAAACRETLSSAVDLDWSVRAGGGDFPDLSGEVSSVAALCLVCERMPENHDGHSLLAA